MVSIWPVLLVVLICQAATFSPNADAEGPSSVCSGLRVTPPSDRAWVPLHHRSGPCSPSYSAGMRTSLADILRRDQLRADHVGRKLSKKADVTLGTSLGTSEYVISVGLGTPAVMQTVSVDTGSDISWVQCPPCPVPPCHRQTDAVFDPSKSSTYSSFPCASPACARLGAQYTNGCSNSRCDYKVEYGDGSNTTGTYSSDTLTMASSSVLLHKFHFGCNHAEPGFGDSDRTDGLLALGGGEQSLVSQTGVKAFSYCLPPTESHTGFLTIGFGVASSGFVVTPMYPFDNIATFYALVLTGITVAGRPLDVPPKVFSAGSIMDSGTIITRLPPTAYRALRAAFRSEMKMYPPAPAEGILDTCFNMSVAGDGMFPAVGLLFKRGATVELDPSGVMFDNCLAFAPTDGDDQPGFIGNVQQKTFEVLYDVGGEAFGFRRGAC